MPELAQLFDAQRARDPTQTTKLRKAFRSTAKMRLRQLRAAMRVAVTEQNVLGFDAGRAVSFHPPEVRLKAFSDWLAGVGGQILLNDTWARVYIMRAWRAGEQKAMRETGKGAGPDQSEAIIALAGVEIEGILNATVQQVTRTAASIVARNTRRFRAVRQLFAAFDKVAQPRLVVMCDVLAIKAYNEAKLSCYANAGIRRVGIHAEVLPGRSHAHRMDAVDAEERGLGLELHELKTARELVHIVQSAAEVLAEEEHLVGILTAGDDRVCQLCEDFADDAPYEIEEVRDVYPLHPRCRCAVYPWEDLRFKGDAFEDKFNPEQPRDPKGVSTGGQWTAGAAGELWGGVSHGQTVSPKQQADVVALASKVPGLKNLLPYLAPDEVNRVKKVNVSKMVEMFTDFPVEAEEMAAVAYSGSAKRGWYRKSAHALVEVFGAVDAPRFAALMAALSPQTGVEDNAINALHTWVNWVKAGRPTDKESIVRIMGESVQGEKGAESILPAWINNSISALSTPNSGNIVLSGPKVDSFAYNLRDHVNAVTLDSWMANYIGIDQAMFARRMADPGKLMPGKGPMYIATAAVVRKAAEILTAKTGAQWTPAEIQETIWSWAKTLYERATDDKTTIAQLLRAGSVTHADIADTPDFAILFQQNVYRKILEEGGYANQAAAIAAGGGEFDRPAGARGGLTSAEGSGIPQDAFTGHLYRAARRLDTLRVARNKRKLEAAGFGDTPEVAEQFDTEKLITDGPHEGTSRAGVIRGENAGAWGSSHGSSSMITGYSAKEMGIKGYDNYDPDEASVIQKNLGNKFLDVIAADKRGSGETLYHGFDNFTRVDTGKPNIDWKVGDTLKLPLTATSGDFDSSAGYGISYTRSRADNAGATVFEFPRGTPMAGYSRWDRENTVDFGHTWAEAIVAGEFKVVGTRMANEAGHQKFPVTVVELEPVGVYDRKTAKWEKRE